MHLQRGGSVAWGACQHGCILNVDRPWCAGRKRAVTGMPTVSPQIRHIAAFRLTCEIWRSYTSEMEYPGSPKLRGEQGLSGRAKRRWPRRLALIIPGSGRSELALPDERSKAVGDRSRSVLPRKRDGAGRLPMLVSRSARDGWVLTPAEWSKERSPQ
jgi:hypothetical protein